MADFAIKVEGVNKNFVLPHEKRDSIKQSFTGIFKNRLKGAETQHALKDISFEVKQGEFFGIAGRNGSGKSTLLKILAGIYQPTKGSVTIQGKLVPFIELGVGFNPELTGRENVYLNGALLGFSRREIDDQYEDIVRFAELERFMDQRLKNYSSGMQVRLAFSLAIRAQADILLVDEVLAVGDAAFQRKCFDYFKELKAKKKTVIFVTHDMSAVREYCDRAMLIDNSELKLIGSAREVAKEYSMLFMDTKSESKKKGDRWGNDKVKIDTVDASVVDDRVVVTVKADVTADVDTLMYGLHIQALDGVEITAMNNRMLTLPDIKDLQAGSRVEFSWDMLNVFNDGTYYVSLTMVNSNGEAYDWYNQAATFDVKREQRSTTSVLPPMTVKSTVIPKER